MEVVKRGVSDVKSSAALGKHRVLSIGVGFLVSWLLGCLDITIVWLSVSLFVCLFVCLFEEPLQHAFP
jgi:hypothetical protein